MISDSKTNLHIDRALATIIHIMTVFFFFFFDLEHIFRVKHTIGAKTSECYHNTETVLYFQVLTLPSTSLGDQEHFVKLLVLYQCCRAKSRY